MRERNRRRMTRIKVSNGLVGGREGGNLYHHNGIDVIRGGRVGGREGRGGLGLGVEEEGGREGGVGGR